MKPITKINNSFALSLCLLATIFPCRAENSPVVVFNAITITGSSQTEMGASGVAIIDTPALNQPELLVKLRHLIGQPITRESLQNLLVVVNTQLAASGETFSVASLPEQDISTGQLKVLVTSSSVGQVRIQNTGAGSFSTDYYRALLRIQPGDVLVADRLDDEIDWISRSNPYRNAQVKVQPGQQTGQTDLEVIVNDRRPYSFSVGYDNLSLIHI